MRISVVGTGYVGLVTGACFAEGGHHVTCVDNDEAKVARLLAGEIPIYEPGLSELVSQNAQSNRLAFTTDLVAAVCSAEVVYLAVGTPQADDGSADLTALETVVDQVARCLPKHAIVVIKSTVPVGTNARILDRLCHLTGRHCDVASNPEFLREGMAIGDFMQPDRVIVGVRRPQVAEVLRALHAPFLNQDRPLLVMSPESAELSKYVANAMLATKISFINEMANICQRAGGDVNDVRRGIGHDRRIGFEFLAPGMGYGGSCFPKDVRALAHTASELGVAPQMLRAVDDVNVRQKNSLAARIEEHFGGCVSGKTIAVWGLAFKPETDDTREAPALVLIDRLLRGGARLKVHDPEAMANVQAVYGDRLCYAQSPMEAVDQVDALAICTEWHQYADPSFAEMKQRMAEAVIFDGRNMYDPSDMLQHGFIYHSIGRPSVHCPQGRRPGRSPVHAPDRTIVPNHAAVDMEVGATG